MIEDEKLDAQISDADDQHNQKWLPDAIRFWWTGKLDGLMWCKRNLNGPMVDVKEIESYFGRQRATLWGRAFDLGQHESRQEAVQMVIGLLEELGVEVVVTTDE